MSVSCAQVGVVLTSLLVDTATVDVDERDKDGKLTGRVVQAPAFSHALKNAYDDKGKGWWKKFGMITMHDSLMSKLSDQEVGFPSACSSPTKLCYNIRAR